MTELIGIAAIAIVAWFAAGTIWNVRTGRELMRWMQGGLPALGQRTTVRWLGSTAVEMVIRDGKAPFASATVVIFLEARDTPWMWAIGRSRGRRDTLIIRGCAAPGPRGRIRSARSRKLVRSRRAATRAAEVAGAPGRIPRWRRRPS